jgi:hypothetical protein
MKKELIWSSSSASTTGIIFVNFRFGCGWFNDDDWRALVEHAGNFNNLKELNLSKNV